MRDHDLGRFYRSLAELGVWASECEFSYVQNFRADEAPSFWLQLAATLNVVDLQTLQQFEPKPICWNLDCPLSREEYQTAVRRMRNSAAGDDEITIGLWRAAGLVVQEAVWEIVNSSGSISPQQNGTLKFIVR